MKRRAFIRNLAVATTLPLLGAPMRAGAAETASPPGKLRVLSCNVRVDLAPDTRTGNGWAHRRELCGDVIASRKADLIGFQEVHPAHLSYLSERLKEFEVFALYNPGKTPLPSNAIFFRRDKFKLVSSGGFWLSETPHVAGSKSWGTANCRFANWVELTERNTGKPLRFWNTHLDHVSQAARENAARLLVEAGSPFPENLAQILTGDMNAASNNIAIQKLKESGWKDTYEAVHGPKDPGFTAHGFLGVNAPAKRPDGSEKSRIDWIFTRGPLKATGAEVIRDAKEGRYPSDHFFMLADLTF